MPESRGFYKHLFTETWVLGSLCAVHDVRSTDAIYRHMTWQGTSTAEVTDKRTGIYVDRVVFLILAKFAYISRGWI